MPIEVKYQPEIRSDDKFGIIDLLKADPSSKKGLILSKDAVAQNGRVITLPVWLFLSMI